MKCKIFISLILILVLVSFAPAQVKRAIKLDDLFSFKRLSGPTLSPDGKWVAFTATDVDLEADKGTTQIYIVGADGEKPKQLTTHSSGSYSPVWHPDSEQIAFGRAGQIWLINIHGGEARQLAEVSSGASGMKWSPDGKKLLFTSFVWPDCDDECVKEREKKQEQSKVTAKVAENLLFRHWNTWRTDGKRSHLFILDVDTGQFKDLMSDADYDTPPFPFGGSSDYNFSPDGKEICFTAKVAPDPAIQTNNDLHILNLSSGKITNITAEFKGDDFGPVYSPDGKYIAYGARERPRFEADQVEIILYDRASGSRKNITGTFDRNISEYIWAPDGTSMYAAVDHHGRHPIYRIPIEGGEINQVAGGGYLSSINISSNNDFLVYGLRNLQTPPTIFKTVIESGESIELSDLNKEALSEISMGSVEDTWFTGANDEKVQMFIVKPPNFSPDKKYPLLHIIHGGPQQSYADLWTNGWNSQVFAARGYVVALVAFHGTPGYGQKFTDAVTRNWGGWPYEDIMKATDHIIGMGYIDENRMAAGGGSYGGYMANWIATQTDRFKALVSHAGLFNLESMYGATEELWFPEWELGGPYWENREYYDKWSPHRYAANMKTPTLVIHGQLDFRVPVTQGFEMFTALQRQGIPSKFIYYPDEDHWILGYQNKHFWYEEFFKWLDKFLGPNDDSLHEKM